MPIPRLPYLPPSGDFVPTPEGESGLDIQISPGRMGGGGNTFDTAIAGAQLQAGAYFCNATSAPDLVANPNNYLGTFMTDFSGNILAGKRLDGVGPTPPITPFASLITDAGANVLTAFTSIKIISGASISRPGIYSPYGGTGLDVFWVPSVYPTKTFSLNCALPNLTGGVTSFAIVASGVPRIINNPTITAAGYVNFSIPDVPIKTAPRPEGYNPGEKGVQIYATQLGALNPQPAPFPALPPGFPYNIYLFAGSPRLFFNVL